MCYSEDIIQSFEVWEYVPLTVVIEAFISRGIAAATDPFPKPHVHINLRLSTGKSQSLLTFHEINQLKMLAEAIEKSRDTIEEALDHGRSGQPLLVTRAMAGIRPSF